MNTSSAAGIAYQKNLLEAAAQFNDDSSDVRYESVDAERPHRPHDHQQLSPRVDFHVGGHPQQIDHARLKYVCECRFRCTAKDVRLHVMLCCQETEGR